MAKVIGEAQQVFKQVTCKNCAAILEYTPTEVKQYNGTDYSGGPDGREWIDCPRCGKEAIIRRW